jgi:hypothetical protein
MDNPSEQAAANRELEGQGARIVGLVDRLLELLVDTDATHSWACGYQCRDLGEEVTRLRVHLSQSVSLRDWASPPPRLETSLEAADKERISLDLLRARLREESEALERARSRNWELEYRCRDLSDEVGMLKAKLRKSVPMDNVAEHVTNPKTAMEKALEEKIEQLEKAAAVIPVQRRRTRTM